MRRIQTFHVAALLAVVYVTGCSDAQSESTNKSDSKSRPVAKASLPPDTPPQKRTDELPTAPVQGQRVRPLPPEAELGPPVMPTVIMSDGHKALCPIGVGDLMPNLKFFNFENSEVPLVSLRGQVATVVFFWKAGSLYSRQQLRDLQTEIVQRYGPSGVRVVAVNVGDDPQTAQQQIEQTDAKFVNLLDPQHLQFAKVARGDRLPRTYVLDASGTIRWFDIEYSIATRRDLREAVRFLIDEAVQ